MPANYSSQPEKGAPSVSDEHEWYRRSDTGLSGIGTGLAVSVSLKGETAIPPPETDAQTERAKPSSPTRPESHRGRPSVDGEAQRSTCASPAAACEERIAPAKGDTTARIRERRLHEPSHTRTAPGEYRHDHAVTEPMSHQTVAESPPERWHGARSLRAQVLGEFRSAARRVR